MRGGLGSLEDGKARTIVGIGSEGGGRRAEAVLELEGAA